MNARRRLVRVVNAGFLIAASATAISLFAAPPVPDREQLEKRLAAVHTLIEKSSAAQQIEKSAVPEALARRVVAREYLVKAKAAYDAGDLALSSSLLPEASVKMFEAVRMAAPEQITRTKQVDDLKARIESVRSLLAAQRRIAAEKKDVAGAAETTVLIEKFLKQGEDLTRQNEIGPAREALDRAYLVAKAAIGSMRGGDTLVRSLTFSTPKDEYLYELDRNDTHKMLLKVAADDERKVGRARESTDKAGVLRASAEKAAQAEDFAGAIRILEESTRELVRAIRGAGLYIPG